MKPLIEKQEDLKNLCKSIKKGDIIAIDIEFMRERTFYPILCLIQINVNGKNFAIDPLSTEINLKPFTKILKSRNITKVLHCARQDIEIIFQELRIIPKSTFDTQLMANFSGYNFNISYANLVKDILGKELDKEQQRSNWQKRPLSKEQIEYALNDVKYLTEIYENLKERLIKENKIKFFLQETKSSLNKKYYDIEKQDLFKKFPFRNKNSIYQANIKTLVLWRDKIAKKKDIPRSFILKDAILNDIAKKSPSNIKELNDIMKSHNIRRPRNTQTILNLLEKQKKVKYKKVKYIDNRLNEPQKTIYSKAQNLLSEILEQQGIRPELIINQNDLKNVVLKHVRIKKILKGWRYKIFGKYLKKLIKVKN